MKEKVNSILKNTLVIMLIILFLVLGITMFVANFFKTNDVEEIYNAKTFKMLANDPNYTWLWSVADFKMGIGQISITNLLRLRNNSGTSNLVTVNSGTSKLYVDGNLVDTHTWNYNGTGGPEDNPGVVYQRPVTISYPWTSAPTASVESAENLGSGYETTFKFEAASKIVNFQKVITATPTEVLDENPWVIDFTHKYYDGITAIATELNYNSANYDIDEPSKTYDDIYRDGRNTITFIPSLAGAYYHITYFSGGGSKGSCVYQIPPASTLRYNTDGGTNISDNDTIFSGATTVVTSSIPTKEGYSFDGWYSERNGIGVRYNANQTVTLNEDLTLYAKWVANGYTVEYDGNGNTSGSTESSSHLCDTSSPLTINGFKREYIVTYDHNYSGSTNETRTAEYSFRNWNTVANGSGTTYVNGANVLNLASSGTITLYAQWTSSSVTYMPTRTGYTFDGWYESPECTGIRVDSDGTYTPTTETILYAKWIANTYTITYNGNGATEGSTSSTSHTYDIDKELTANGFIKEYNITYNYNYSGSTNETRTATYTFKGWNTRADGTGESYGDSALVSNLTSDNGEVINLYAQWNLPSISFVPERPGYTFEGWYSDEDCTNKVADKTDPSYTPLESTTLYAKWEINNYNYTVEYYYNNVLDESKTDEFTATYEDVIETYTSKVIDGYKLDREENLPLLITENESNNVIKIYYILDDEYKKELSYIVEYYKDGEKQEADKQIKTEMVPYLQPDIISVDKTQINLEDKYYGYKLEKTEPSPIPDEINSGETINIYYVIDENQTKDISYTIEYYKEGEKVESEVITKTIQVLDSPILDVDKEAIAQKYEGYQLDETLENLPDKVNDGYVLKVYYKEETKEDETKYTIEYYYENVIDNERTETLQGVQGQIITEEEISQQKENNIISGYKFIKTENLPLTISDDDELNIIKIYYERKDAQVVVKYVDKYNGEEISESVIKKAKVFDEFDVSSDVKDIEGYTLVESPEDLTGTYTEEEQTKIYYYAKNGKVTINYIDKITQEKLEVVTKEGLIGDTYIAKAKNFDKYVLEEKPEQEIVIIEEDEIILNYYYTHISNGVIEQYINPATNKVIESKLHKGKEGDPYKIEPKEIEGYDIVEEKLPENAEGKMTIDVIEVKYYYERKTSVRVEYIDKITGKKLPRELEQDNTDLEDDDSTEYIYGHEGDKYETTEKAFEKYNLVEKPKNATGKMGVTVNEDGTVNTVTVVQYYYSREIAGIKEEHIDLATGEVLKEIELEGYEGDTYTTSEKQFKGYVLVRELYPDNSTGSMQKEETEVKYYYARIAKVEVEYIDKETKDKIIDNIIINGYEGKRYETEVKVFDGYKIVEKPENAEGKMKVTKDKNGDIDNITKVTYYYIKAPEEEKEESSNEPSQITNIYNDENKNGENSSKNSNEKSSNKYSSNVNNQEASVGNLNNNTKNRSTPSTGDMLPIISGITMIGILAINIVVWIIHKKRKDKKSFIR